MSLERLWKRENDDTLFVAGSCVSVAFTHTSVFDVPWLSSVGGGWERKPTQAELTTLLHDPRDLPAALDARNAEVLVYHM